MRHMRLEVLVMCVVTSAGAAAPRSELPEVHEVQVTTEKTEDRDRRREDEFLSESSNDFMLR